MKAGKKVYVIERKGRNDDAMSKEKQQIVEPWAYYGIL